MSGAAASRLPAGAIDKLDALARTGAPRFIERCDPFRHWVASDVFPQSVLDELGRSFEGILARGLAVPAHPSRLSKRMAGYDAYALSLTRLGGPLELFHTRRWHDLLAELTGVRSTLDVSASMHHHAVGSETGKVHNDFNPAFFADNSKADGVNVNDPRLCSYQFGEVYQAGFNPRACVRAVTMLFYLANPPWRPGDGGETGLYRSAKQPLQQPTCAVPPVNNSLLVFECTPASFHTFLSNRAGVRNSVILWLHRTREEAVLRWGESALVPWKR
jgi:hypothetical protein